MQQQVSVTVYRIVVFNKSLRSCLDSLNSSAYGHTTLDTPTRPNSYQMFIFSIAKLEIVSKVFVPNYSLLFQKFPQIHISHRSIHGY